MKHFTTNIEEILKSFETSADVGLSDSQANEARAKYGENKFAEPKKETLFQRIFGHMKDFTTLILLVAGFIALYSAMSGGSKGPINAIVIFQ